MAIYHFSGQIISRSAGRSSVAASAYRSAQKMTDARTGEIHDFTRKTGVDHSEVILPDHAPAWMADRSRLWDSVEAIERRKDAQLAREFNVALPIELTHAQQIELAQEFVQREFVQRGMVAQLDAHDLASNNPHIHIMATMRNIEGDGWGKKNRDWNDKTLLEHWRKAWADTANRHLERAGHDVRIDHRSLADQGITDREPQKHLGQHASAVERKTGEPSRRRQDWQEAMQARAQEAAAVKIEEATIAAELAAAQHQVEVLELELDQEIAAKPAQPRLLAAPTQPSSNIVRRALEQAQKRLFDPKTRIDHAPSVKAVQRDLDKIGAKRTAAGAKLWDLKGEIETALPMQRWEAEQTINEWRKKHPLLSWFHDRGVQSAHLSSFERALEQISRNERTARRKFGKARESWNGLNQQHADLAARLEDARGTEMERLQKQLEPLQAEVDRLEFELEKALDRESVLQPQAASLADRERSELSVRPRSRG